MTVSPPPPQTPMPPGDGADPPARPGDDMDEGDWRRLDARMLLVHPVQEAVRFLPAILAVVVAGRVGGRRDQPTWELALVAIVVLYGISRWFTTRYRIQGGQIELRQGLVIRQTVATPADRIRTVDVTAPLLHRILGLARVVIGTGSGQLSDRIMLDSLGAAEATRLRGELLHRRVVSEPGGQSPPTLPEGASTAEAVPGGPVQPDDGEPAATGAPGAERETTLVRLSPSWIRYAPFTSGGLLTALAFWGFSVQFLQDALWDWVGSASQVGERVSTAPLWAVLLVLLSGFVVALAGLSIAGYLLSFWGFRLTRHPGGTLHTSRGLLTSRQTSIEEARVRGVELGEPLGLRLAGARRLHVVTTGLHKYESQVGGAWLCPPAPQAVVARVATEVVADGPAVRLPLTRHGPAARRRRYLRAVVPALLVVAPLAAVAGWRDWPDAVFLALLVPLPVSLALAADRYAGLGHTLTPRHLVVRSGSLTRRRDVLQRRGVIGFTWRESLFQRRAGVVTLTATTAAGRQGYRLLDVDVSHSVQIAHDLDPAVVAQFLADPAATGRR